MKLFELLKEQIGNFVCVQDKESHICINFPPEKCKTEKEVQKYSECYKIGFPGKIVKVEDDFLEIEYFTVKTFGGVIPGCAGLKGTVVPYAKLKVNYHLDE